jgi:polyhydroxyalkanoate synthesis regulator phasin
MKKLMAGGVAALALTTGSLGAAALLPLGVAGAQTDSGSTTTTPARPTRSGHLDEALKALVTDGTLTQAQADAIKAKLDALRTSDPAGARGAHGERGKGGPAAGANPEDIASALGITAEELRTQLQGGASLRSIAGDKVAALTTLLTEKANARIDEQLKAGKIDQAKADELKAGVAAKIQEMLDRTGPPQGGRGPKGGHGPRGPQGMTPPSGPATTPSSTSGGA